MLELIAITSDNAITFAHLIREDVYLYVPDPATVSIGVTDDGMPMAALLFRVGDDGSSEILSVCVDEAYRRQGIATELLAKAADYLVQETECSRFFCRYDVRSDQEDSFGGFLEYLGFVIARVPGGCFVTTIGDLKQIRELEGSDGSCISYAELTTMQRKQLHESNMDLGELMDEGKIDESMSTLLMDGKAISGCVLFAADEEEPEALSLIWAENTGNPSDMLFMMRHALHASSHPDDKKIYIPVLNERSERLVEKLLGEHAQRCEKSYEARLDLFSEENDEFGETA